MPRNYRTSPLASYELERYFCLRCEQSRANLMDIRHHVKMAHGDPGGISGADFESGLDIVRRLDEEDAAADRFDLAFESLRGADDFLLECGDA